MDKYWRRWGITRGQLFAAFLFFVLILVGRIVLWHKQRQNAIWNEVEWQRQSRILRKKVSVIDSLWRNSHPQKGSGRALPQNPTIKSIDINSASKEQLMTLPGIGPALAERIIEWRKVNGSFSRVEDLQKIAGIGKKRFEKIVPFITLKNGSSSKGLEKNQFEDG